MNPFRLNPDSLTPTLDVIRRRRRLWLLGISVVAIAAFLSARPVYRLGKTWRARALAAEVEELTANQKWDEAAGKARAAYQLDPTEAAAVRAVARLYTKARAAAALGYWKALLALPASSLEDRRDAAEAALQFQDLAFAGEQIKGLLEAEPRSASTLELAARFALLKKDKAAALEYTARLLAEKPDDPAATFVRAQLLFSSSDESERNEGKKSLQALGKRNNSSTALAALLVLGADQRASSDEITAVADALESHPQATFEHQLTAVSLRIRVSPDRRARLVDQTAVRFHQAGPETVAALGRWLMQQGELERVLEVITAAASAGRQDLFLIRMDALAGLGRWREIQQVLKDETAPIQAFHREVFLARAAKELHEDRAAEAHWARATVAANRQPALLLYLAQYAERVQQWRIAEKAWRELASSAPALALRANLALVPILERDGKTRGLREVMREIIRLAPDDPVPRNDRAYLDLLLGENIEEARLIAERLVRDQPNTVAFRTTLALAHLRVGDAAAAARVYEGLEVAWDQAPPGSRAVRVAVLKSNGDDASATALSAITPITALKPEERALIAQSQKD